MEGNTTLPLIPSTVNGSVSPLQTIVNANTSYAFLIQTYDLLSSTGKIKISIPTTITIDIHSNNCAKVIG